MSENTTDKTAAKQCDSLDIDPEAVDIGDGLKTAEGTSALAVVGVDAETACHRNRVAAYLFKYCQESRARYRAYILYASTNIIPIWLVSHQATVRRHRGERRCCHHYRIE